MAWQAGRQQVCTQQSAVIKHAHAIRHVTINKIHDYGLYHLYLDELTAVKRWQLAVTLCCCLET
jgi:hypothetical protein